MAAQSEAQGPAIAVICKAPRPGLSKTRLAASVGPEAAARLAAAFLADVGANAAQAAERVGGVAYAAFRPSEAEAEIAALLPAGFRFLPQEGGDLGAVMRLTVESLLRLGHGPVVLIGADTPTLPPSVLLQSVEALRRERADVAIGPALDGGYYLIGMRDVHPVLFEPMPWGSDAVLALTLERAQAAGLRCELLPKWHDVDDEAALSLLRRELAGNPPHSASTGLVGYPGAFTRAALREIDHERHAREAG
jgi:hypothetical protein